MAAVIMGGKGSGSSYRNTDAKISIQRRELLIKLSQRSIISLVYILLGNTIGFLNANNLANAVDLDLSSERENDNDKNRTGPL